MTEQEYIDATNLAKLRTATTIVRDCLPMRDDEKEFEQKILQALARWVGKLEKIVSASDSGAAPP